MILALGVADRGFLQSTTPRPPPSFFSSFVKGHPNVLKIEEEESGGGGGGGGKREIIYVITQKDKPSSV